LKGFGRHWPATAGGASTSSVQLQLVLQAQGLYCLARQIARDTGVPRQCAQGAVALGVGGFYGFDS